MRVSLARALFIQPVWYVRSWFRNLQYGCSYKSFTVGGERLKILTESLFFYPFESCRTLKSLLLDEPTNHLDLESVLWLGESAVSIRHRLTITVCTVAVIFLFQLSFESLEVDF